MDGSGTGTACSKISVETSQIYSLKLGEMGQLAIFVLQFESFEL